jgi:hypothetical protein
VSVNGVAAESQSSNFAEWQATVPVAAAESADGAKLRAHAVDQAGNTEPRVHVMTVE